MSLASPLSAATTTIAPLSASAATTVASSASDNNDLVEVKQTSSSYAPRPLGKRHRVTPEPARSRTQRNAIVLWPDHFAEYDPFLMMAEDWFRAPGGFPDHPHRGFETVTLVLEGQCEHKDSRGGSGVLGPGDVQWMTAGRGVIHSELPYGDAETHALQLWLNLPKAQKLMKPRYQDLNADKIPVREEPGVKCKVISGGSGSVKAPTKNVVPVLGLEITMEKQAEFSIEIPDNWNGFMYVMKGQGLFGPQKEQVSASEVVSLPPTAPDSENSGVTSLWVKCVKPLHFILFAGKPLREPVVQRGPFVMNTQQEIEQAFSDFQKGKFK